MSWHHLWWVLYHLLLLSIRSTIAIVKSLQIIRHCITFSTILYSTLLLLIYCYFQSYNEYINLFGQIRSSIQSTLPAYDIKQSCYLSISFYAINSHSWCHSHWLTRSHRYLFITRTVYLPFELVVLINDQCSPILLTTIIIACKCHMLTLWTCYYFRGFVNGRTG